MLDYLRERRLFSWFFALLGLLDELDREIDARVHTGEGHDGYGHVIDFDSDDKPPRY